MTHAFRIALVAVSLLSLPAAAGGARIGTGGATIPEKPLEGQRLAPCGNNVTEINGGCWTEVKQASGACWFYRSKANGRCYAPLMTEESAKKQ